MAKHIAKNEMLNYALRALQLIFAIIIMGTDGYAIHVFRGHTDYVQSEFGDFYNYYGVPNAWGFLTFCACWTILTITFHFIAATKFTHRASIGYIRVGVEAVAVLSWLAGFIAVAVQISTDRSVCSVGRGSCGEIVAATVFGALEWLLFVVTASLTTMPVLNGSRKEKDSTIEFGIKI